MTEFHELANAKYMSIESYRADGTAVRTPVWVTADAGKLHCWSLAKTGKIGRIGNNPNVRLAVCDARGQIRGEWTAATGSVIDDRALEAEVTRRMRAKYGLIFLPFRLMPKLSKAKTLVIEFTLR